MGWHSLRDASGVGFEIDAAAMPMHPRRRVAALVQAAGRDPVQEAVAGGDDYELLFTVHPRRMGRLKAVERLIDGLQAHPYRRRDAGAGRGYHPPATGGGEAGDAAATSTSLDSWIAWPYSTPGAKLLATIFVVGGSCGCTRKRSSIRASRRSRTRRDPQPPPKPGSRLLFSATAYCKGSTTASGVNVRSGIAAADPDLLPVGSVVEVDAPGSRYDGVYTVMDTGPRVQGRHVDLYMWSCHEALRFGRAGVRSNVLRLGWSPAQSAPGLIDRLQAPRDGGPGAPRTPQATVASRCTPAAGCTHPLQPAPSWPAALQVRLRDARLRVLAARAAPALRHRLLRAPPSPRALLAPRSARSSFLPYLGSLAFLPFLRLALARDLPRAPSAPASALRACARRHLGYVESSSSSASIDRARDTTSRVNHL